MLKYAGFLPKTTFAGIWWCKRLHFLFALVRNVGQLICVYHCATTYMIMRLCLTLWVYWWECRKILAWLDSSKRERSAQSWLYTVTILSSIAVFMHTCHAYAFENTTSTRMKKKWKKRRERQKALLHWLQCYVCCWCYFCAHTWQTMAFFRTQANRYIGLSGRALSLCLLARLSHFT